MFGIISRLRPLFLIATAVSALLASAATERTWKSTVYEGWIDEVSNWQNSKPPATADDEAVISATANKDYTVYLPSGGLSAGLLSVILDTGSSIHFVGTNRESSVVSEFEMSALAEGTHPGAPFNVYGVKNNGAFFRLGSGSVQSGAVFCWSDADLKLTRAASGTDYTVDFNRGDYNFYNPGEASAGYYFDAGLYGGANFTGLTFNFRNATTDMSRFRTYSYPTRSEFNFLAGSHTVHGAFAMANQADSYYATNVLTVASGATLTLGTETIIGGKAREKIRARIEVDGGTFDARKSVSKSENENKFLVSGRTVFEVSNGGALMLPSGATFGYDSPGYGCTLTLKDVDSSITVGKTSGQNYGFLRLGEKGPVTFDMDGGTLGGEDGGLDIQLGYGANNTAAEAVTFNMNGGFIKAYGGNAGVDIGGYGGGAFNMNGGTVHAYQLRLGLYNALNADTVSEFRQTGGFFACTNQFCVIANVGNYPNRISRLILDGGVLEARRIYGKNTVINGGKSPAYIFANGGTVQPNADVTSATDTFLQGFDAVKLGAKGLTLSAIHDITVAQKFENQDDAAGRLVKTGAKTLTLLGAGSTQSVLEIAEGVVALGADATLAATVAVTNGAVFDVSAAPAQALGGLVLGDAATSGRLIVTTTSRLALAAAPSFANAEIVLSGGSSVGTYPLISTAADVDAGTKTAWRNLALAEGRQSGLTYNFTVTETDGTTDFNLVVGEAVGPSRTVTWPWGETELGADAIATFGNGGSTLAEIADGIVIGSLAFPAGASSWTISGTGAIRFADTGGYGSVDVKSGEQVIELPVGLSAKTTVNVESGASLTLAGPVSGGGIVKTGGGRLVLSPESALPLGVETRGGTVAWAEGADTSVEPLKLVAATATSPLVLTTEADVTARRASVSNGALIKRGVGRLEIAADSGSVTLATGAGVMTGENAPAADALDLGDGTAEPTKGFGGFNVFEGEVRLRGTGTAKPTFVCDWQSQIGIRSTASVSAAPGLVVDHAVADFDSAYRTLFMAANAYEGEYPEEAVSPYLYVTNGSQMTISGLEVGRMVSGSGIDLSPRIRIADGSKLVGTKALRLNRRAGCTVRMDVSGGSSFESGTETVFCTGPTVVEFTDESSFKGVVQFEGNMSGGSWAFRSGSVFRCAAFAQYGTPTDVSLVFDGGAWNPGNIDYEFMLKGGAYVDLVAGANGFVLDVPEDKTWKMFQKVTGEGAVVKRGEGLLRFERQTVCNQTGTATNRPTDTVTLACAKGVRIEEGAVTFAEGAGVGPVSGAGAVVSSTLTGLVLLADGETAPTLSDCELVGTVRVDFADLMAGVTEKPYPTDVAVARLTDGTPFVASQWRGRNVGTNRRATFRLDGDTVRATVMDAGFLLILR